MFQLKVISAKSKPEDVCPVFAPDIEHFSLQHHLRFVNERNVVAQFFYRFHVVGGKDDGFSFIFKAKHFIFYDFGIHGVESAERFVENQQIRIMDDGGNKLHFLLHPFREFFHFAVVPACNIKSIEPDHQLAMRVGFGESAQLRQIHRLLTHFHFFVQSALFGQVADIVHVFAS